MKDEAKSTHLRRRMLARREELMQSRSGIGRSWQEMQEPERELEEQAKKQKMSRVLEQFDARDKEEIERIDVALHKMELGDYGMCESCGKEIEPERLEALPWAAFCVDCKTRQETGSATGTEVLHPPPLPHDLQGMSDDELCAAVYDELRRDGRVELEELSLSCENGVIGLNGALPSEAKRSILLDILQDTMGLHDIEDNIVINRVLWQRRDRTPERHTIEPSKLETLLEGEAGEEDPHQSRQEGRPLTPPDDFIPESEE